MATNAIEDAWRALVESDAFTYGSSSMFVRSAFAAGYRAAIDAAAARADSRTTSAEVNADRAITDEGALRWQFVAQALGDIGNDIRALTAGTGDDRG